MKASKSRKARIRRAIGLAAMAAALTMPGLSTSAPGAPVLVKDINPSAGSNISSTTNVDGTLFFVADDGTHGGELWKSDGTEGGTELVRDINPGSFGSDADELTAVGTTLFFVASDGTDYGLWKSDGTTAGTVRVEGSPDGADFLTNVDGTLFFNGGNGLDLWKSDGTAAGTVLVEADATPMFLTDVGGTLFFNRLESGLWKSDGTPAGTVSVKEFEAPGPQNLIDVGGTLFFQASDGTDGGLWKSDGTELGTVFLKAVSANEPTDVGGTLFFAGFDATSFGIWKSDGTEAGTVLVKAFDNAMHLMAFNGALLFAGDEDGTGWELWKSDGTTAGTVLLKDISPGGPSGLPDFAVAAGTLYFPASDATHGNELWASDGTEAGTILVGDINPYTGPEDEEHYRSSSPSQLVDVDGTLFLSADDGTHGHELWKAEDAPPASNCTLSGTTLEVTVPSDAGVVITRSGQSFEVGGPGIPDPTCGGATMSNVDSVEVTAAAGNESLTVDLSNGQFAPGATTESSGSSEIEFDVDLGAGADDLVIRGSAAADTIRMGAAGINLNNDNDADVAPPSGVDQVTVSAGSGNDTLLGSGAFGGDAGWSYGPLRFYGEDGKDRLTGGLEADTLDGGPKNDKLLQLKVPDGADWVVGGLGVDVLSYASRMPSAPVAVSLDGEANDGGSGGAEGDNVGTDVENVNGGRGGDLLIGSAVANDLRGGRGDDDVYGRAGNDRLNGNGGADDLFGEDGNDVLDTRDSVSGNDTLWGGADTDTCQADPGDQQDSCNP